MIDKPEAVPETKSVENKSQTVDVVNDEVDFHPIRKYFEMDRFLNDEESKKLKEIAKYFSKKNVSPEQYQHELRKLEIRLGGPQVGETRLGKIHNWLKLSDYLDNTLEQMSEYGKHSTG